MSRRPRLLVIGAGPVGLEAALHALKLGYGVRVLERGRVGENILDWGHVRMFSAWEMNCSPLGLDVLARAHQRPFQDPRIAPTGREYVTRYLRLLASCRPLRGVVEEGTRVLAIGRDATTKQDLPGDSARGLKPFRILAERSNRKTIHEADIVLDLTGTSGQPRPLGNGGIEAPGERQAERLIDRGIPDLADRRVASRFADRTTLLVGGGHSAATTAIALSALARRRPRTRIVWAFRRPRAPLYPPVVDDPLPGRRALVEEANQLAEGRDPRVVPRPGSVVEQISFARGGGGRLDVTLKTARSLRRLRVDRIVANVGYTPDASIHSELQVHLCYASGGPMNLAAALLGEGGGDCLKQVSPSADLLANPEPGFYILGAKSYGRNSTFLIRAGLEQVAAVFAALGGDRRIAPGAPAASSRVYGSAPPVARPRGAPPPPAALR
ncbi:MAG TPA: NAD(P)-binding domain-containing protein [Candidatus Polarisedimenticolia bacterium]|nr:NAD(P)-binding domain-containing protein [Candidatus Polarisedimenticolia bacterium]